MRAFFSVERRPRSSEPRQTTLPDTAHLCSNLQNPLRGISPELARRVTSNDLASNAFHAGCMARHAEPSSNLRAPVCCPACARLTCTICGLSPASAKIAAAHSVLSSFALSFRRNRCTVASTSCALPATGSAEIGSTADGAPGAEIDGASVAAWQARKLPAALAAARKSTKKRATPHAGVAARASLGFQCPGSPAQAVSSNRKTVFCLTAGPCAFPDRTPEFWFQRSQT